MHGAHAISLLLLEVKRRLVVERDRKKIEAKAKQPSSCNKHIAVLGASLCGSTCA